MVYASEMNFLQLQTLHLALHELLITQLTLSVMREQSRLQRRPSHLSLNETQRHVVRAGASVLRGPLCGTLRYAHQKCLLLVRFCQNPWSEDEVSA